VNDREWNALGDRLVAGEPLSPEESQRLVDAAQGDPARAAELELFDALDGFVAAPGEEPSAESIAIAHAALARVAAGEPRVRTDPPTTTRRRGWIAGGCLAAATIAGLAWWWPRDPEPVPIAPAIASARLTIAAGEVSVDGRPLGNDVPALASATTIAVRDGRACLAIDPGIDVCLDGATTASIEGLAEPEMRIDVRHGHAVARLDPLPDGRRFALAGGQLRAVAVGTLFSLDVSDDGASLTASVLHGEIAVHTPDGTTRVGAHEVVRLRGGRLERERLSADAEARELELLAAVPVPGDRIGHVAIEVTPAGAMVELDGRPIGTSPVVAALPVGEHRLELRGEDGARVGETLRVQEGTFVTRRFALASDDPTDAEVAIVEPEIEVVPDADASERDTPPRARPTPASPRELLALARTLRRADRWRDAANVYRRLLREHPRSSEAHTALVSLGDLSLDRLDQPAEAARAYLRYVREGGGSLAPEARWGVIRARRQQGDARGEREASADFLSHHPDDARAKSLR
jgi:hypothetical protein